MTGISPSQIFEAKFDFTQIAISKLKSKSKTRKWDPLTTIFFQNFVNFSINYGQAMGISLKIMNF